MPNVGRNQVQSSKCTNLYNLQLLSPHGQVIQICTLGDECTNLYTLDWERGVQICTPMPVFRQISMELLQTV